MDAYEEFKNKFEHTSNLGELGEWLGSYSENSVEEKNKEIYKEIYKYAKELNEKYKLDKVDRYKFQKGYNENYNIFTKNKIAQEIINGKKQNKWRGIFTLDQTYYSNSEKLLDLVELVYKDYLKVSWGKSCDYSQYINAMNCLIQRFDEEEFFFNKEFDFNCITILFLAEFMENNMQRLRYSVDSFINTEYFYIETKKISNEVKNMEHRLLQLKEDTENANQELKRTKEDTENANQELKKTNTELKDVKENLETANDKIKNINNNMITIMALFLTAFSIIGVNIYSLDEKFEVNQIVLINSSLVFVLSFLMYLLDKIINAGKANLGKIVIWAGVVLMVVGFIEPIISKFI